MRTLRTIGLTAIVGAAAYLGSSAVLASRDDEPSVPRARAARPTPAAVTKAPPKARPEGAKPLPPLVVRTVAIAPPVAEEKPRNARRRAQLAADWNAYRTTHGLSPDQERAVLSAIFDVQVEMARVQALYDQASQAEAETLDPAEAEEREALNLWINVEQYPVLMDEMKARLAGVLTPAQLDAFQIDLASLRWVSFVAEQP